MPRRDDDFDDDDRPRRRRRPPPDLGDDAGMRLLLPVGRSPWAVIAGYLGLVSVLFLPAPFALFCGVMAVRHIRRDPKAHGMGRAVFGIVMGGLFTSLPVGLIVYGALRK